MKKIKHIRVTWLVILFGFLTAAALAAPPKVLKSFPENGAEDVDAKLRTMRIVFDQDMESNSYSICDGPKAPKIVGTPRWINKRTFSMRIRLAPEQEYEIYVNCPNFKNFRSQQGESVEPYTIRFKTATGPDDGSGGVSAASNNTEAIAELRRAIEENYSYRDIHKVDWDKLFEEKANALKNAETPKTFATTAGELLANAKDKHIWLTVGEQHFASYRNPVTPNANFSKLKDFVPKLQKRSAVVYTGEFEDGIGYILIDSWNRKHTKALEQTYVAIWEFSDAPGLIIDVRGNGGGAEPLAQEFAGCFIDEPKVYAQHVYRAVNEQGGFTKPNKRTIQPNKRRPRYRGKTAVLMGPVNMSSCEAFLLMMKQVPGCKLVGEVSQGSSGNPKAIDLGNGVTVFLPSWKAMRADGTCFEGEGIQPDVPIKTTQTELLSRDAVLEAALKLLR